MKKKQDDINLKVFEMFRSSLHHKKIIQTQQSDGGQFKWGTNSIQISISKHSFAIAELQICSLISDHSENYKNGDQIVYPCWPGYDWEIVNFCEQVFNLNPVQF